MFVFIKLLLNIVKIGVAWPLHYMFDSNSALFYVSVPEEFSYDPVSKTYGEPQRRPEIRSATIEFIAPSEYMVSDILMWRHLARLPQYICWAPDNLFARLILKFAVVLGVINCLQKSWVMFCLLMFTAQTTSACKLPVCVRRILQCSRIR